MIKSFLILISFSIFAFSSQQILLVVAKNVTSPTAKLQCFENGIQIFDTIDVNIGKNGLGIGLGKIKIQNHNIDLKKEGDKKAPIGIFKLSSVFGYEKNKQLHMPYIYTSKDLICVDDSKSRYYNQIIHMPKNKPNSFELMKREDNQYKIGIVVEHNKDALEQRGSCIFIHLQKHKDTPTVGCTSMNYKNLNKIIHWLDKSKNPILIQIPRAMSQDILQLYPELKNSKLLNKNLN